MISEFNIGGKAVRPVLSIDCDGNVRSFDSVTHAAVQCGLTVSGIVHAAAGTKDYAGAYRWKYAEQAQLDGELWRHLDDIDVHISDQGRFRRKNGVIRNGRPDANGYYYVRVNKHDMRIHRLVARAFLGEPPRPKMDVLHIDGNKSNNAAANLRYVDSTRGRPMRAVRQLPVDGGPAIAEFCSVAAASAASGVPASRIIRGCKYETIVGGFRWQYVDS